MHSVWSIALGTRGPPDLAEGSGTESLTGIPELTHPTQQNSETFRITFPVGEEGHATILLLQLSSQTPGHIHYLHFCTQSLDVC